MPPKTPGLLWMIHDRTNDKRVQLSRHGVISALFRYQDRDLDIYNWSWGQWRLTFQHRPSEYCHCGQAYDGFMFKEQKRLGTYSDEDLMDLLESPFLCKQCYYKTEWRKGRWAPRNLVKIYECE